MRDNKGWGGLLTLAVMGVFLCGGLHGRGFNEPAANSDRTASRPADKVFLNGIVYTADLRHPWAQAVAVSNGNIVYVGSSNEAKAYAGPRTRVIDLKQATLLPGIIDSHIHPAQGEFYRRRACNVVSLTANELYSKIAECAKSAPAGEWVVAFGWNAPPDERITLARLDALVPDRKLLVISGDSHTGWVNSTLLRDCKITRDTPDPAGGRIDRDTPTREPSGVLHDAAVWPIINAAQTGSAYGGPARLLFAQALPYLNTLGITSILDALVTDELEAGYHELDLAGKLTMNVSLAFMVTAGNYRTEIPRIAAKRAHQTPHTRVDFIKVFADGNIEDNLADMLPVKGHPDIATHGYYTQAQMNEVVRLAEHYGLSVFVHSIGDGAAREVLDAIAAARTRGPCPHCRHTITHLCWVSPADMPRFRQLHVLANIQEGWLAPGAFGGPPGYDYAKDMAEGPLGAQVAMPMLPYRQIQQAGAFLSAGSDWFYTDENPWHDMESGATSRDPGAAVETPMLPDHTVDVESLLRASTINAAYQMYAEKRIGSIEVGKQADFVVIDRNILKVPVDDIHNTRVLMTIFEGRELPRQFPLSRGSVDTSDP
jgi:predicted amidohydrolase YtcJ